MHTHAPNMRQMNRLQQLCAKTHDFVTAAVWHHWDLHAHTCTPTYIFTHTYTRSHHTISIQIHAHIHTYAMHVHTATHMHTCTHTYTNIAQCMYTQSLTSMHTLIGTSLWICTGTCACTYTYSYGSHHLQVCVRAQHDFVRLPNYVASGEVRSQEGRDLWFDIQHRGLTCPRGQGVEGLTGMGLGDMFLKFWGGCLDVGRQDIQPWHALCLVVCQGASIVKDTPSTTEENKLAHSYMVEQEVVMWIISLSRATWA